MSWTNLPIGDKRVIGKPVVISGGGDRLDIFFQDTNLKIYHIWRIGDSWQPAGQEPEQVGGVASEGISAVATAPDRIHLVARGFNSGAIWHRAWVDGNWDAWESLEGTAVSQPVLISWGPGRLDVFVRFADENLWHRSRDGQRPWNNWESLGGQIRGDPAPVTWGPNRLDVVVCGLDNQVHHKYWIGGNSWLGNWGALPGVAVADLCMVTWGANLLHIFCDSLPSHSVFYKSSTPEKWVPEGRWEPIGGGSVDGKAHVVAARSDLLDVVQLRSDHQVWHRAFNGSSWVDWRPLGGNLGGQPVLSPRGSIHLEVFGRGPVGELRYYR